MFLINVDSDDHVICLYAASFRNLFATSPKLPLIFINNYTFILQNSQPFTHYYGAKYRPGWRIRLNAMHEVQVSGFPGTVLVSRPDQGGTCPGFCKMFPWYSRKKLFFNFSTSKVQNYCATTVRSFSFTEEASWLSLAHCSSLIVFDPVQIPNHVISAARCKSESSVWATD